MARNRDADWAEAKRLCRLSREELRMARAMGMNPRGLIKNRPSPSQRWKAPVGEWVRELYRKRFGDPPARRPQPVVERVVLIGSVGQPLVREVPRFAKFRRAGLALWHECKDVDSQALNAARDGAGIRVAHHQVDGTPVAGPGEKHPALRPGPRLRTAVTRPAEGRPF